MCDYHFDIIMEMSQGCDVELSAVDHDVTCLNRLASEAAENRVMLSILDSKKLSNEDRFFMNDFSDNITFA